jgi:tetratricopeptide (TPR) repeat protein
VNVKYLAPVLLCFSLARAGPAATSDLQTCASAVERGEFASAARLAHGYVRLHPASVPARILLARAYMGLNNGTAALLELREAIRREPDNLEALYYISKLAGVLSQMEFGEVSQIAPDSARMHQIQAEALEARGDAAGAEKQYLAALERRPETAAIMNALGDLMRLQKDYDSALAWYAQALQRDPESYDALYGTGACYRYARSPQEALPMFRRALKADPSSLAAKMALGESLLMTGDSQHALPLLEVAAKADPNLRRLQFLLGRAYRDLGRTEEARKAFERVRALTKPEESDQVATEDQ